MAWSHELQLAVDLARGAGRIALSHFGDVRRLTKTHAMTTDEAVTIADRACQRHIVAGVRSRYPGDGIIGEESETGESITFDCPDPAGRVWVIDPIDGTNNFIAGFEAFAVCIALLEAGRPMLGVVYDVARERMYSAAAGQGAWMDNRPIAVASEPINDSSLLMLTSNLLIHGRLPGFVGRWMGQTNWKTRILGSAALEACAVASGVAHGAITVNGKLWDVAAPAAIVLEAGGSITTLEGEDIFPFDLRQYRGAKVPFLTAAPGSRQVLLQEIREHP